MTVNIQRLIAPRSIALIGAGAWTDAVAAGNRVVGYPGVIWRVHPHRPSTVNTVYYPSVLDLPEAPDAAFVAVPNHDVPGVAAALAARGAGGFVCFTAGFSETGSERGLKLTQDLLTSAASLPFFGPNCYGFVNFFDRAALLPDQVVGGPVERGVALICQSGTIALTLMFNDRSLPIGALFTVGNQTSLTVERLIESLCDDPRVTAFGLYLEGVKDTQAFAAAAEKARLVDKPIALVKSGRTAAAARTAHSHTGALAGEDSVFESFCRQAGIARCDTLSTLCETLKIFHSGGVLPGRRLFIMGASGGDMAMSADVSRALNLDYPPVPPSTAAQLSELLTDRVSVANPLDMHTYLWFDPPALGRVFHRALRAGFDLVGFMLDCPPDGKTDASSFEAVIDEFIAAAQVGSEEMPSRGPPPSRAALIASLPETLNARVRRRCFDGGVVPLQGQREALEAVAFAGTAGDAWRMGSRVVLQGVSLDQETYSGAVRSLSEADGKAALAECGVRIPRGHVVNVAAVAQTAATIGFPVVIKAVGAGLEHKTEAGGVILHVGSSAEAMAAAQRLAVLSEMLLVEEMVTDGVAEILVGILADRQFGQVLVIGAGGVFAELLTDSVNLLPPWTQESVEAALTRLSCVARLMAGYRNKPRGDRQALVEAILCVGRYASAHVSTLLELDVNPLIVRPVGRGVVAVDVLIRHKTLG